MSTSAHPNRVPAVCELAEAIRLTREYVGADLLPAVDGWSWYDALRRWAPEYLPQGQPSIAAVESEASQPDDGYPEPPPELSELEQLRADNDSLHTQIERVRWALGTEPVDDRLRQAEIRAAVAEHEARAYREQVHALIRAMQRERGVPEEELPDGEAFVVVAEREPSSPEAPGVDS